ncbi:hypothetical protein yinte0001_25200 [Yersinia intermedia ATCC 29909]|nr:hypothetical protein yinte0001_25200 [Yersinia intermedia ATCC 29909]
MVSFNKLMSYRVNRVIAIYLYRIPNVIKKIYSVQFTS